MAMFHLEYTDSTTFFKWDEIGCLCRALGFPSGLFQSQLQSAKDEIPYDEKGLSFKTLQRVWNLNLMFKPLHRTFNMHTADWNTCTFTTALHLLTHRALSFQDLHNIRVAYMAYEHIDMKGMVLDKHTLLRTLKMCGRTIAPLKLMHRIKHMKGSFEEKGRIQLYEFFTLILWCDMYISFKPEDMEMSSGKEEDLFRLVDFQKLLTHHDERMARNLDTQYLKEEWDFGMECLGPKELFKEPVVNTEARIAQTQFHTRKYRHLKQEVGLSQKRLYRAHAGTIRSRPVSAPDLEEYRKTESAQRTESATATQMYESVQRRLHSAPSRASTDSKLERPSLPEYRRAQTPPAVTPRDLTDVQVKMENLAFDMNTLDVRCELQVEKEMDFYIPGYMEKLANRRPEPAPVQEPEKKPLHWTSKIINNLAYPPTGNKHAHNKSCDARLRGWQKMSKSPGTHVILTSQTHTNTEHGRLFSKMEQTAMEPVQYLHPDYILRYTPKSVLPITNEDMKKGRIGKKIPTFNFKSIKPKDETGSKGEAKCKMDVDYFHSKYLTGEQSIQNKDGNIAAMVKSSFPVSLPVKTSINKENERKELQPQSRNHIPSKDECKTEVKGQTTAQSLTENLPIPHMEHSRPKIVGVGQIGTISLLESIQESRDLEEQFVEEEVKITDEEKQDDAMIKNNRKEDDNEDEDDNKEDDEEDDITDAEQLSLKLNLKRDTRFKKPRKPKDSTDNPLSGRKAKSAPSIRPERKNLRKSPVKMKRNVKSSVSSRCKSADERQSSHQKSGSGTTVEGHESTLTSYDYSSTLSSADENLVKFKSARGSLTSEENDGNSKETRNELSSHLNGVNADLHYNKTATNDDESVYSDALTLPSSVGMTELGSPPLRRSRLQDVPDISIDLESSMGSTIKPDRRMGHHVQFDVLGELRPDSSSLSFSTLRPEVVTSFSDRKVKDDYNILNDFRDYVSDSGVSKRVFSKQTRTRLIGRVENAISPDLKMRLLADNNKISIPAS